MRRKLKKLFSRIPRPAKAIFCATCAVALAILYYIALGSPAFTFEQEFRRAEKANLVGPSKILDTLEGEYAEFDRMIVGETEHGICFFGRDSRTVYRSSDYKREEMMFTFSYREKTGNITVLAAPNYTAALWDQFTYSIPVYVFDCYPEAVRAELELTITGTYSYHSTGNMMITDFSERFSAEAERTGEGFFRFMLKTSDKDSAYALKLLSDLSSSKMFNTCKDVDTVVPGTVRLYDENGNLIIEHTFEICSAIAAAHKG